MLPFRLIASDRVVNAAIDVVELFERESRGVEVDRDRHRCFSLRVVVDLRR